MNQQKKQPLTDQQSDGGQSGCTSPHGNGTASQISQQHLLPTLGLCARARRLIIGTPMVCEALQKGDRILCVLEACDTSDNTHGRLTSKCAFYQKPLHRLTVDAQALGRSVGKSGPVAAVGITDAAMLRALEKYLPGSKETTTSKHSAD